MIRENLETDGHFTEGTGIELMDECEACGGRNFVLKFLPRVVIKSSTPTTPTQKGNGGNSDVGS
jgi:hypothetical protein